jgi:hypothetical protein
MRATTEWNSNGGQGHCCGPIFKLMIRPIQILGTLTTM